MRRNQRGSDRDVETQLRAARPEPAPEVIGAVADRVRPRRGVMGGLARVPLGLAGGLTAIVVAVTLALGGATGAVNTAGGALNIGKANVAKDQEAPAIEQHEEEAVLVCVFGIQEQYQSSANAAILVGLGLATYGPCPGFDV